MKSLPTFEAFKSEALAQGFDEVLERQWEPGAVFQTHTHPFAVSALVTRGEMWLEAAGIERRLVAGDRFTLERHVPHAERYGAEGATYWVARRN